MAFIRKKKRGNRVYYYLVEGRWINGKVKQKVLSYLGTRYDEAMKQKQVIENQRQIRTEKADYAEQVRKHLKSLGISDKTIENAIHTNLLSKNES